MELTIETARAFYTGADAVHDFDHVLRVLALAERIARAEGADWKVVRTATLLHDWGRDEAEMQGLDHAEVAAGRAGEYLRDADPAFVAAVTEAILAHRFRSGPPPAALESRVLYDADKLDAIGAVGVARAFAYGGAHQSRLWAALDEIQAPTGRGQEHTPVHEFVFKLARIKDQLYTPTGRAIAAERHAYMEGFFQRLDREMRGEI